MCGSLAKFYCFLLLIWCKTLFILYAFRTSNPTWSSGQDSALSPPRPGFDSRRGKQLIYFISRSSFDFFSSYSNSKASISFSQLQGSVFCIYYSVFHLHQVNTSFSSTWIAMCMRITKLRISPVSLCALSFRWHMFPPSLG